MSRARSAASVRGVREDIAALWFFLAALLTLVLLAGGCGGGANDGRDSR